LPPEVLSAAENALGSKIRQWITDSVAELKHQLPVVAAAFALATILGFIWVLLMRLFTKLFIYVVLIGSVVAVALFGGYLVGLSCHMTTASTYFPVTDSRWQLALGIVFLSLALLLLCLVIALRSRLALSAALIKEACRAVNDSPSLLLAGLAILAAYAVFVVWWVASMIYIYSIPSERVPLNVGTGSTVFTLYETSVTNCVYLMVFGFFWVSALASAIFQMTVAGSIAHWYFSHRNQSAGSGTFITLLRALTLSLGSLALGSLIIAILDFLNYILEQVKQLNSKNKVVVCVVWAVQCCLGCLRGVVKFVNRFAYIYIAIHGHSFCKSARDCYSLVSRNLFTAVVLDTVIDFVVFVGKVLATALCGFIALAVSQSLYHSVSFAATGVVVIVSYFVLTIFSHIVGTATDTVFVCYLEDLELHKDAKDLNVSPELHDMLQARARALSPPSN
jgi:hypothetical protein